jgi:hypothetical protein
LTTIDTVATYFFGCIMLKTTAASTVTPSASSTIL